MTVLPDRQHYLQAVGESRTTSSKPVVVMFSTLYASRCHTHITPVYHSVQKVSLSHQKNLRATLVRSDFPACPHTGCTRRRKEGVIYFHFHSGTEVCTTCYRLEVSFFPTTGVLNIDQPTRLNKGLKFNDMPRNICVSSPAYRRSILSSCTGSRWSLQAAIFSSELSSPRPSLRVVY